MLHRSTWSGLLLSAAVSTAGLLGFAGAASAQDATAPAAAAAPAPDKKLAQQADDFLHYVLVNNLELAKANGEAILNANAAPGDVLAAFEGAAAGRNLHDVLSQAAKRPDLKDVATKLQDLLDEGYRTVARDPVRIRAEIERLGSGPRGYENARERLVAAGQYGAPIYIEYLENGSKRELRPYILRVMGEIGRPLLLPLIEGLRINDPAVKIDIVNTIGRIGYPQALPALRAMQNDANVTGELKTAVDNAIRLLDQTGMASKMSAADLSLKAAQNYYDKKPSYQPLMPDEKSNPIWVYDPGINNVTAIAVPTAIWNNVMTLRFAESTLKQDANNGDAISLWLAASLRREIQLPAGATDPTKGNGPDASFYALAAGPAYVNPVLTRALDAHDAALALRAIAALEATGGSTGLVNNGEASPLVRALSYPDRAVRFQAAFTLARANPTSQFPSFFRVIPILSEAIGSTGAPTALVVGGDEDARNKLADTLRNSGSHFQVFASPALSTALDQARRAPAIDVVVVASGPELGRVAEIARSDYRLAGVPVLVTTSAANLSQLKANLAEQKGFAAVDAASDEAALTAALTTAKADAGSVSVDAEKASQYATTALELLGTLAADHKTIYPINEAVPALSDALKDKRPEIATSAARVLGRLNSGDAQKALASVALATDTDASLRVAFYQALANSAKQTGNALDASAINTLIKVVSSDSDAKIREAAAAALGALNVPSNQASTLILQQAK